MIELLDGEVWKERDMRIVDGKFVLAPYDISIAGTTLTVNYEGKTTVKVDIATDPVWTAGSAGLTARYACIYEVGGDVLCYCLLDSTPADVSVTEGNTLTCAAHADGIFTLA